MHYLLAIVSHPLCFLVHGTGLITPIIWGSVLVIAFMTPGQHWPRKVDGGSSYLLFCCPGQSQGLYSLALSGFGVTAFNLTVHHTLPL